MSQPSIVSVLIERLKSTTNANKRLSLLQSINQQLLEASPEVALPWLEQTVELADELRRPLDKAEAVAAQGDCHAHAEQWKEALRYWDRAIKLYKALDSSEELIILFLKAGRGAKEERFVANAADYFNEALTLCRSGTNVGLESDVLKELGDLYSLFRDYSRALPCYLDLLRLVETPTPSEEHGNALNDIGITYAELEDNEQALHYLQGAYEQFKSCKSRHFEVQVLVNLANIYAAEKQTEQALDCGIRALTIYDALGDRYKLATTLLNLSSISEENNNPHGAIKYRLDALDIFDELGSKEGQALTYLALGELYHRLGKENDGLYVLEQALRLAEEINNGEITCRCHEALAATLENIGDTKKGLHHLRRYIVLQRKLDRQKQREAAAEIQAKFDLERSEKEREILQLKTEQLEAEVQHDKAELHSLSLKLIEKDKFIEELLEKIKQIEKDAGEEVKSLAQDIMQTIKQSSSAGDNWKSFQEQFEKVHHGLLPRIAKRWPALTQGELQLCALTISGLTTGEIATLLHIEKRSVETKRSRARKKLEIDPKLDLAVFLQGI